MNLHIPEFVTTRLQLLQMPHAPGAAPTRLLTSGAQITFHLQLPLLDSSGHTYPSCSGRVTWLFEHNKKNYGIATGHISNLAPHLLQLPTLQQAGGTVTCGKMPCGKILTSGLTPDAAQDWVLFEVDVRTSVQLNKEQVVDLATCCINDSEGMHVLGTATTKTILKPYKVVQPVGLEVCQLFVHAPDEGSFIKEANSGSLLIDNNGHAFGGLQGVVHTHSEDGEETAFLMFNDLNFILNAATNWLQQWEIVMQMGGKQQLQHATKWKQQGNSSLQSQQPTEAIEMYTKALFYLQAFLGRSFLQNQSMEHQKLVGTCLVNLAQAHLQQAHSQTEAKRRHYFIECAISCAIVGLTSDLPKVDDNHPNLFTKAHCRIALAHLELGRQEQAVAHLEIVQKRTWFRSWTQASCPTKVGEGSTHARSSGEGHGKRTFRLTNTDPKK
eukprot:TRINITY_DN57812_c0_g1_i2.p1 TRINITY_DN57812_c0_g1~~TRINITY_DN57812_c0_g1_i2.p1  ORF type:complete len:440 (-),score=43.41 TRINITY_DN57812_c0_g1_i2:11-1330(-)